MITKDIMFEKLFDAVIAYCFGAAELLLMFIERTHAIIGVGVPLLLMIAVHIYAPAWVAAALAALLFAPAALAMVAVMVYGSLFAGRR